MTILMSVALALVALGAATTAGSYKLAPVSNHGAGWDVAFASGISTAAFGGLGALLLLFTA